MIRKIWIINLMLAIAAVVIFSAAYRSWNRSGLTAAGLPAEASGDAVNAIRLDKTNFSRGSYDVIEKNNLFSPERAASVRDVSLEIGIEENVPEETTPPFIKQKYTLFGIIIKENETRALIQAPVQDKETKPVRWVSVNDAIDEFTVSEILQDKIYIKNSTGRYAIPLYKPKEENAPTLPAAVQTAEREAPKVISTQRPEEKKTAAEEENIGDFVIDGNYKIIETPFGKSRIRIK